MKRCGKRKGENRIDVRECPFYTCSCRIKDRNGETERERERRNLNKTVQSIVQRGSSRSLFFFSLSHSVSVSVSVKETTTFLITFVYRFCATVFSIGVLHLAKKFNYENEVKSVREGIIRSTGNRRLIQKGQRVSTVRYWTVVVVNNTISFLSFSLSSSIRRFFLIRNKNGHPVNKVMCYSAVLFS